MPPAIPPPTRFRITKALREFLHEEATSAFVLVGVAVIALIWANSAFADSYFDLWHHEVTIGRGEHAVTEDLIHWVNDGLMVIFFFVVGLEIKRELAVGELRNVRAATMPAIAALGGVILPALIYVALAPSGDASKGWGIPMATDIAFAVGVLALTGARASGGAKLLLLSIAIVDDILAILVIAIFYTEEIKLGWLAVAAGAVLAILMMRLRITAIWPYLLPGLVLWFALFESGVHATLAGVICGLLTPAGPVAGRQVLDLLIHRLHPVSAFLVLPLFGLANAGIDLRGGVLGEALTQALPWAVAVALVVGKTVGILGAALLALRLGLGELPSGMRRSELGPLAALGGIGFTVSLFIADLAFADESLIMQAKIGIFMGSIAAAVLGVLWLILIGPNPEPDDEDDDEDDAEPAPSDHERPRTVMDNDS